MMSCSGGRLDWDLGLPDYEWIEESSKPWVEITRLSGPKQFTDKVLAIFKEKHVEVRRP